MERLTDKDEYGYYAPRDVTLNCLKHRGKLVDRLASYEDTGLEPEEVRAMKRWRAMRDYEELVKALREADSLSMCGECGYKGDKKGPLFAKAADAIEELQKRVELEYQSGFADGQRAANRKKNKWISVEERLPDFMHLVLAWVKNKDPEGRFNKDGVYVARLEDKIPQHDPEGKRNFWGIPGYDSEWTVYAWSYFTEPEVTHWMPLPEPPEEENND